MRMPPRAAEAIAYRRWRVRQMTLAGLTIREISEQIPMHRSQVVRVRSELGLTRRPPNVPMTAEQLATAERLLDDGASFSEVARTVGVSTHTIWRRFPGRGWTIEQCVEYRRLCREFNPDDDSRGSIERMWRLQVARADARMVTP